MFSEDDARPAYDDDTRAATPAPAGFFFGAAPDGQIDLGDANRVATDPGSIRVPSTCTLNSHGREASDN